VHLSAVKNVRTEVTELPKRNAADGIRDKVT